MSQNMAEQGAGRSLHWTPERRRGAAAWCLYDWANSPFVAVITTFVFAAYFTEAIAETKQQGTSDWGFAMGASALAVAFVSPVLGAIADRGGRRKPWLAVWTGIVALCAALLWFAVPDPSSNLLVLWTVGIATAAFELGMVFYNALLPGLVPERYLGRISGWAWALGYFGGLACLILVLVLFVLPEDPILNLKRSTSEHIRIVGPVVALWIVLFSIPVFIFVPDAPSKGVPFRRAVGAGLRQLWETIVYVRRYKHTVRFLIGRMLYIDGINTIFIFGGLYAQGTFGLSVLNVLIFGIVLNVTAGIGAFALAWLDDAIGAKPTILLSIGGLLLAGIPLLLIPGDATLLFYILGGAIGLFFGPIQAASRSLMARLSPPDMEAEMFGLYAFSGRATAFVGPWVVGVVALEYSQRWAMATTLPIIFIGALVLFTVNTRPVDPDTVL